MLTLADDRQVDTITLSPDGQLAACTDDKGRVFVMNVQSLAVVRAWKGYRDSQCAWLRIPTLDANKALDTQPFWSQVAAPTEQEHRPSTPPLDTPTAPASPLAPLQRCVSGNFKCCIGLAG